MSLFEDELKKYAPGMPKKSMQVLEAEYGSCAGFCTGLDVFARVLLSDQLPKNTPVFGEPWKSIYTDTVRIFQQGGGTLTLNDAMYDAIDLNKRPIIALSDAIIKRQSIIAQSMALKGSKRTSDDYKAQLNLLGYDIRLNLAGNKIEVNGESITDITESIIENAMFDAGYTKTKMIENCINELAQENEFHPIKDYLNSLTWDGKPYIEKLAKYFIPRSSGLFPIVLRKWLIGAIARVMDGDQNPMLVLEGPQGCGKSTFSKWLCPDVRYHKESNIDPDNKDHRIATSEIWIWEVGELGSTTKKADREALKNFLTTDIFTERPAYGRHNQTYKAMASFIGTVNNENGFLNDPTGSRRFWVMGIDGINFDYYNDLDPNDIWAEAMAAYKAGEGHDLDKQQKESIEEIADEYRIINSTEEAIKKWFVISDPLNVSWFTDFNTIREILQDPGRGNLSSRDTSDVKIASALKALGLYSDRQYVAQTAIGHNKKILARGYVGIKPL